MLDSVAVKFRPNCFEHLPDLQFNTLKIIRAAERLVIRYSQMHKFG